MNKESLFGLSKTEMFLYLLSIIPQLLDFKFFLWGFKWWLDRPGRNKCSFIFWINCVARYRLRTWWISWWLFQGFSLKKKKIWFEWKIQYNWNVIIVMIRAHSWEGSVLLSVLSKELDILYKCAYISWVGWGTTHDALKKREIKFNKELFHGVWMSKRH